MIGRLVCGLGVVALGMFGAGVVRAQDVPGIEICTVEKTMERRTSCLQSNVDFLQKMITRLGLEHQQKLEAGNRQIEALKASITALQKTVSDLQAEQPKDASEAKKADTPPAKETTAKDVTKDSVKDGAAKEGGK
jgi:uncharacterized protein HemX